MLEITPDDVAHLSDTDLRSLIGLLCESELRSRGLSAAAVTWGGHQNAADGGLDVRIALPEGKTIEGFVPRPQTGLQVKSSSMPPGKILDEMRPEGVLRPVIRDLANRSGAYVIVSAESTTGTPFSNRHKAMQEAVNDLPNAKDLALDFYDRGRVATWVRDHAGMVLWVRDKVGRPLPGWRPYEAWAYAPDGVQGEYLLGDGVRVRTDAGAMQSGLSAGEGIQRIRDRLSQPRGVVRLVGLSGVGKTRLVQALFDSRVGDSSLNPAWAFYTDVADAPDPPQTTLVQNLIASRSRAIVVVDNCPPELHRRVSDACRVPESTVSVITVEYDIKEDQPEGTEVFELEASSGDLIEKLLKHRFPRLSWVDLHTIVQFSEGNARIAIALAEAVHRGGTIAGLSDEELFKRLFEQRHEPSESLLIAAQALSLVYSFEGEDISEGENGELFRLGAIVGKSAREMFQYAADLLDRRLVQRRGVWRAVLPQAIANRLAARALRSIHASAIEKHLIEEAPDRLLRSFSRRLGYLDASAEARQIVGHWLGADGLLADVLTLNGRGEAMLMNVAPVDPEATLLALERAARTASAEELRKCSRYVPLLVSLAYEARDFQRVVALLARIAVASGNGSHSSGRYDTYDAIRAFSSLFTIQLSGTHASSEQREAVIRSLLKSASAAERNLATRALDAALMSSHFGPFLSFGFGARSRDFGYWPATRDAVLEWFGRFLKLAEGLVSENHVEAPRARTVVADKFRGLWTGAAMYDDLERVCRSISESAFWREGWIAVRETMYYDSKGLTPEVNERLARLEALLAPRGTVQRVRSIVLAGAGAAAGIPLVGDSNQTIESAWSRLQDAAYELGTLVAGDSGALAELLPELLRTRSEQIWSFGRGLALGAPKTVELWQQLIAPLRSVPPEGATPWVLRAFLSGLHQKEPVLAAAMLDGAVDDDALAEWYPALETAIGEIGEGGHRRLLHSLELGRAPIQSYRALEGGRVTDGLSGQELKSLLLKISNRTDGIFVAIEILYMRLFSDAGNVSPGEFVEIGCELVRHTDITGSTDANFAQRLQIIGRRCLLGDKGAGAVTELCDRLRDAVYKSEASAYGHRELLQVLFNAQPFAVLQSLCAGSDAEAIKAGTRILEAADLLGSHTFGVIPEEQLFHWCDELPEVRYPIAAAGVAAVSHDKNGAHWTEVARKILEKAPDRTQVLKKFIRQLVLPAWDESRTAEVESNLQLLDDMASYSDPQLLEFAASEKERILQAIATAKEVRPHVIMDREDGFE